MTGVLTLADGLQKMVAGIDDAADQITKAADKLGEFAKKAEGLDENTLNDLNSYVTGAKKFAENVESYLGAVDGAARYWLQLWQGRQIR